MGLILKNKSDPVFATLSCNGHLPYGNPILVALKISWLPRMIGSGKVARSGVVVWRKNRDELGTYSYPGGIVAISVS